MSESLRFGLQRPGWRRAGVLVLLVPFAGIGIYLASNVLGSIHGFEAIERHSQTHGARGPRRVAGTLQRDAEVVSPLGQRGLGWAGVVGFMSAGRTKSFVEICGRGDLADLRIEDGPRWVPLTLVRPGERLSADGLSPLAVGPPRAALAMQRGPIPPAIAKSCAPEIAANRDVTLQYREGSFTAATPVEVFACARDDGGLEPCHDGLDLITTSTIDLHVGDVRSAASGGAILATLWNLFSMGILAMMLLDERIRTRVKVGR